MRFEFDPVKSAANKGKHGIDFIEAQALWADEFLLEAPALNSGEPRFLVIGRINGKNWSAIYTLRGDTVRLISVRRSRKSEVDYYESQ